MKKMATADPPFSSHYPDGYEVGEWEQVYSAGRYGNINSKLEFFKLN